MDKGKRQGREGEMIFVGTIFAIFFAIKSNGIGLMKTIDLKIINLSIKCP
jgi:hypothetical protein